MAKSLGMRQVGFVDVAGGGQVVVRDGIAYVGHMRAPHGTTIIDVRDPARPVVLAELSMPPGTHSHKVRVAGNILVINQELNFNDPNPPPQDFRGGICIYDVSNPREPQLLNRWETGGQGVHRFDLDGRYAYLSSTTDGYLAHIVIILDLENPGRPVEVGRWWMPGQWIAGGETPTWDRTAHRCHHPLRRGNRLYTSYWQAGFVILDIDDISKPKRISGLDWSPPYHCPTHTTLPLPFDIRGRRYMVVADEDVYRPGGWRAGILVDGGHHQRAPPRPRRKLPGRRTGGWSAALVDRLPPALRNRHRDGNPDGLVRLRAARNRRFQPAFTTRSRLLCSGCTAGSGSRSEQRRYSRRTWVALSY